MILEKSTFLANRRLRSLQALQEAEIITIIANRPRSLQSLPGGRDHYNLCQEAENCMILANGPRRVPS
jgi:hypothetical protein